jgi:hypothetical protein
LPIALDQTKLLAPGWRRNSDKLVTKKHALLLAVGRRGKRLRYRWNHGYKHRTLDGVAVLNLATPFQRQPLQLLIIQILTFCAKPHERAS